MKSSGQDSACEVKNKNQLAKAKDSSGGLFSTGFSLHVHI